MIRNKNFYGRPLLYIDLLGFSADIMRQTIKESKLYYSRFLHTLSSMTEVHKKLRFTFVSDSAFLWINGSNSKKNAEELIEVAFSLYHNSFFSSDESIRGSIVYDEFEIAQNTFTLGKNKISSPIIIGKGIINGYRWEQVQNWLGISIHPYYIDLLNSHFPKMLEELENSHTLNIYNVPTKNGNIQTYAIGLHSTHIEGKIPLKENKKLKAKVEKFMGVNTYESLLINKRKDQKDLSVLSKLTETLNYIQYIKKNKLGRQVDWKL
jgi:hypothetical protein